MPASLFIYESFCVKVFALTVLLTGPRVLFPPHAVNSKGCLRPSRLFQLHSDLQVLFPEVFVPPCRVCAFNNALVFFLLCGREERIRKEEEERKRQKSQAAENKAKLMEAFLKEKEKEVLQLQEEAKSFITPENLDARIEECLDNPRNYNFAIDKEGRIVKRTVLS
uniref:Small ribosomal subunit protein mS26 n=1 Tax=Dromaius novaehollandiae TaxID=8790 RepID=A0A8C4KH27_DRONO